MALLNSGSPFSELLSLKFVLRTPKLAAHVKSEGGLKGLPHFALIQISY